MKNKSKKILSDLKFEKILSSNNLTKVLLALNVCLNDMEIRKTTMFKRLVQKINCKF